MDDTPKTLAETLAIFNERLRPFRELSERLKQIQAPYQRLGQSFQPFTKVNQHKQNGVVMPQSCLVPLPQTPPPVAPKPPPEKRPSTLDKNAERREIYQQVVAELGRYAQQGVLLEEAAKRAGCTARTMWRAITDKK
ncbi:hypothetical protein [Thiothrix fructosivorans]|uniref:Resolvase HTH domain-containing protein n=1 Tax=Thiothrix fructosivorans TaxID=111770 RepID=A0ABS3IQT1_9GAMM|nr:hypothetical protein [Thiothrix fructosivorans]MBO0615387.1 hypothetical protein [Thiothrix fructosivorans]